MTNILFYQLYTNIVKTSKSLLGLVSLFVVAKMVGWGAVRFDNYLVDVLKLKSSSIIITEMNIAFIYSNISDC